MSAGPAGWLLARSVALLPAWRRDWGRAMVAELAAVPDSRAQRRFAVGCLVVVLRQPGFWWRAAVSPLLLSALVAAAGWLAGGIGYPPLRIGSVGLMVLLALLTLGAGGFAPATSRRAGAVRAGGVLAVAGFLLLVVDVWRRWPHVGTPGQREDAGTGLPVYAVLALGYLAAFVLATRARPATRAVPAGAGAGLAAALLWLAVVLPRSTVPAGIGLALLAVLAAIVAAAWLGGRAGEPVVAGLTGGMAASLLVVVLAAALRQLVPARVPDVMGSVLPPGTGPPARLANNELEAADPYLLVLALGWLLALGLVVVLVARARAARAAVRPAGLPAARA